MRRRLLPLLCWFVLALTASSLLGGCCRCGGRHDDDGTTPVEADLPRIEIKDDTPDLLLTWIDSKGDFHVVQKIADVPEEGRDAVRVYVVGKEDGTRNLFYVADLRTRQQDGTYPYKVIARSEWELMAEKRRDRTMSSLAPPSASTKGAPPPPPAANASKLTVIVYGASWCQPCHDAHRYLRRKGITVVEKDIDEDEGARREMKQKLARAGMADKGSIPVIDVKGRILQGFDPRAVDRAIAEVSKGEEL